MRTPTKERIESIKGQATKLEENEIEDMDELEHRGQLGPASDYGGQEARLSELQGLRIISYHCLNSIII